MKKIILFLAVSTSLTAFSIAQQIDHTRKNNNGIEMNQYLSKAKKQKTAAWICLGGGILLTSTGIVTAAANVTADLFVSFATLEESHNDYTGESILMILGGAGIIASVPLFISSGKNRQKARLLFTNQKTIGLRLGASTKIPGLTFSLSL